MARLAHSGRMLFRDAIESEPMENGADAASETSEPSGIAKRIEFWTLLEGSRLVIAGLITTAFVLAIYLLFVSGVIHIGADSSAPSLFASGLTAGVITLVTIALSVNQLILSRVFGSPNGLSDRLEGSRSFRDAVEDIADIPSSPNDPAAFLSLIGQTIEERATNVETAIRDSEWSASDETMEDIRELSRYGAEMDEELEEQNNVVGVLDVVLGTNYARNIAAINAIQNRHAETPPDEIKADFDALEDLLESVAIARQFFKTLLLQQDFARLSRYMVYTGLTGLLATVTMTLIFRTNAVTIPARILPEFTTLGFVFIVAPIAVFTSFILRAATIAEMTVSVGPFIPPEQR